MSEPTNQMHLGIMKNNQLLVVLFSNAKTHPQASNTLNLFLKRNDTVWVQRRSGRVLHAHSAGPYNVFSGVLVTRM
ncbi:hypothetical protein FSP39_003297 [Pinctada imbricata]|uniref:C1q domain-containing protein n=1 Tax=Pinctada imbricata TaxID=66713 RepID=A0AA89BLQ1_PINIB|nr:hypothetical protein FSP39_003297 [Pinctada imbricata]